MFVLLGSWTFDYQLVRTDVSISDTPSDSGAGIYAVQNHLNDFGASDNALKVTDRVGAPDMVQFPTVAAAVVIAYNLPGYPSTSKLVLTRPILSRIYLGDVRVN